MENYLITTAVFRGIYYDEANKTLVDNHPDNWSGLVDNLPTESPSLKELLEIVCERIDITYSHDAIYAIEERRSAGYTTIKMSYESDAYMGVDKGDEKFIIDIEVTVKKITTALPTISDIEEQLK